MNTRHQTHSPPSLRVTTVARFSKLIKIIIT